ncbi:hypothetical protein [Planktothricoides raciborskii]|uniref:Uncharacterized protein n=2 Tax=Planktothricoides raciborskii TaxID=132608 RepID=A0AAU8JDL6_9CYAN|nr:hypothetical protein [Planktothricoides raciborskii]
MIIIMRYKYFLPFTKIHPTAPNIRKVGYYEERKERREKRGEKREGRGLFPLSSASSILFPLSSIHPTAPNIRKVGYYEERKERRGKRGEKREGRKERGEDFFLFHQHPLSYFLYPLSYASSDVCGFLPTLQSKY